MRQSIPSDGEVADFPALGEDVISLLSTRLVITGAISGGEFPAEHRRKLPKRPVPPARRRSACYGSQLQEFAPVHTCPFIRPESAFFASKTVNIVTPKNFSVQY